MNYINYITFIKSVIVLILFIPIILFITAVFKIEVFENLSKIADSIGGITSPLIGILGVLLVFFTFEQQRFLINNEIEKVNNKNSNIKSVILFDLATRQYPELLKCKYEIEEFNKVRDDLSKSGYFFNESIILNSDFFNSIPIQDLYEAFQDKSEFYSIVYIYKKIDYIKTYALNNLFQEAMFDYTNTITYDTVLNKHRRILDFMPEHIQTACDMIQGLEYNTTTEQ